jgi:hypothetical protein
MRRRTAVLVLAGVSVFTGCSPFGERAGADLIRGARAAYATIPPYPGATEISHSEDTARAGDGSGPVTGGGVLHVFRLPRGTSVRAVATFYRRRLAEHGWSLRETLPGLPDHRAGPVLNFRRGRDDASVNLEGGYDHELELGVVERAERPS